MNETLERLKEEGLLRSLADCRNIGTHLCLPDGSEYLNFSSNDYLGLSAMPELQDEFLMRITETDRKSFLFGSTSSRLITGNFTEFGEFEEQICSAYGRDSALVFNSGYHANTGILPALAGPDDLILADKLVHASIIDALKLSKCKFLRYSHNDIEHLEKLLKLNRDKFKRIFIATESVFSMDGDFADLKELVSIKERYGAFLYVDEAHAVGVFGKSGLGLCEELSLIESIDIIMCTLGKALAGEGAYAVCSKDAHDMLVNFCRSLIFTTAMPPINVMWDKFAFSKMRDMSSKRAELRDNMAALRKLVPALRGQSQIAPLVIGSNADTLAFSDGLKRRGIWASPIRHPTVPAETARIRFSAGAAHSRLDIDTLASAICDTARELGIDIFTGGKQ